jgi:hypothetical protein
MQTKEEAKQEAIHEWVMREFSAVPQEWVHKIMEADADYQPLPMWGTMWIVHECIGEMLWRNSRVMAGDASEIDIESISDEKKRDNVQNAITGLQEENIDWAGCAVLEEYMHEEMRGARCILDTSGNTTAAYIYEIAGEYVVGIHAAGWNFYDGIWDKLYDLCGIRWHEYAHA